MNFQMRYFTSLNMLQMGILSLLAIIYTTFFLAFISRCSRLTPQTKNVVLKKITLSYLCSLPLEAAKLLEKYILTGPSADVLPAVQKEASGEFSAHIAEALEIKDTDHRAAVKQFGSSCGE